MRTQRFEVRVGHAHWGRGKTLLDRVMDAGRAMVDCEECRRFRDETERLFVIVEGSGPQEVRRP